MNNNFENLYYDYIGAIGTHTINDYIDYTCNILDTKINSTSNILKIYTDNKTSNLRNELWEVNPNNNNCLIKSKTYNDIKHTYIINSNLDGEIRFSSLLSYSSTSDPISDYSVKIDTFGKLFIYHKFNIIQGAFPQAWYDVEGELFGIKNTLLVFDASIGALVIFQANATNQIVLLQALVGSAQLEIQQLNIRLNSVQLLTQGEIVALQSAENFQQLSQFFNNFAQGIRQTFSDRLAQITAGGISFGIPLILCSMADYLNREYYHKLAVNYSNANLSNLTQSQIDILDSYTNDGASQANQVYYDNTCNLSIIQGFINSNINTTQFIPSLNTNQISFNNINVSNLIYINSNTSYNNTSNSSNTLFNSIINTSNNNYIYSSNSIDKINILLPNANFWYDGTNAVWCYDLNIEKYVPSTNLGSGYKCRSFRIITYVQKADWRTGYNLLFTGTNDYINFPDVLTIHMNNNKQTLGVSVADDTYANGVILGKSKNTNIGYWNFINNNYNYIRYITKLGWDTNVVIERL